MGKGVMRIKGARELGGGVEMKFVFFLIAFLLLEHVFVLYIEYIEYLGRFSVLLSRESTVHYIGPVQWSGERGDEMI